MINIIKYIILAFLLITVSCQNYSKTEFYSNGQIKSEETRNGVPNWSENKNFNLKK